MVYPVRQKRVMVELSQPYHMMISGCAKEDQEIVCNPLWRVKISPFLNWKRNNNMQYYYMKVANTTYRASQKTPVSQK